VDGTLRAESICGEDMWIDSDRLLGILTWSRQLLDWEGASIVPEGPEEALVDYLSAHASSGGPTTLALLYSFRKLYGAGIQRIRRQIDRYSNAIETFVAEFGPGPLAIARVPARINILGEHVDYVDYVPTEVLPFASREHDMLILFRPSDQPRVRGRSTLEAIEPGEFGLDECPPRASDLGPIDELWLQYLQNVGTPKRDWMNYVKASVFHCAFKEGELKTGVDFLLDSTLPAAGGASSSSAVVILAGTVIRLVNGISFAPESLAEDASKAEWYIGTRGGKMDHCTMCLSHRQHALHVNFHPFATELIPLHRYRYRWVAFFSHAADKGGDVLLKFNERSAASRVVIPVLLERMFESDPILREGWECAVGTLACDTQNTSAAEQVREVLMRLPETLSFNQLRTDFPQAWEELLRSYPELAKTNGDRAIVVRKRALHHIGDVVRVRDACRILREIFDSRMPEAPEKTEPGLRALGDLITESHESLRDLYEVTTPDIDELIDIILSHSGVYGARLMGGGFGGNILALVGKQHVAELVGRVQSGYYAPRNRHGLTEGSVMVSTPGEGLGVLCLGDVLREAVVNASAVWWKWDQYGPLIDRVICELLRIPSLAEFQPVRPIQPIIIAGGKGELDLEGDYHSPASLNVIGGKTSIEHVVDELQSMPFDTLPPIVVVSPAMKAGAMELINLPDDAKVVVQPEPLGTGNAVLAALGALPDGEADVVVVWGSQPLLTSITLAQSVRVHQALGGRAMVFPTAVTHTPYAPIQRNLHGFVMASRETAAEGAPTKRLGETNVGAFVLSAEMVGRTLTDLHNNLWQPDEKCYATRSGDLGFPNEMARALVEAGEPVIAIPIAHETESHGLRSLAGYEEVVHILAGRT
jgi:galactokinase